MTRPICLYQTSYALESKRESGMKTFKTLIILLSFVSFFDLLTSCEKREDSENLFLVSVDSVKLPETILTNTPFDILCYGTIGTNGCSRFSHFVTEEKNKIITIETWAEFHETSSACPTVMVYLDGQRLNLNLKISGSYLLRLKGKDGMFLEKQIIAE